MPNEEEQVNPLFLQLILSLQSAAWFQLGKTMSPITGKIERNLDEARVSIDLLNMLQEKTKGNLLSDEKKILDNAVYTLQMNYIDEVNLDKEKKAGTASPADEKAAAEASSGGGGDDASTETPADQ